MNPDFFKKAFKDPRLRFCDDPESQVLFAHYELDPDPDLAEVLLLRIQQKVAEYEINGDAFWENNPPKGTLKFQPGCVPLLLPINDVYPLSVSFDHGCLVVSPPGGGKTLFLALILIAMLDTGGTCLIFTRKQSGESVDRKIFWNNRFQVYSHKASEVPESIFQPVDDAISWASLIVPVIAGAIPLIASKRVILKMVIEFIKSNQRWPKLSEVVKGLKKNGKGYGAEERYADTAVQALEEVLFSIPYLDVYETNALDQILSTPGCHEISTEDLSENMAGFYISVIMARIYHKRRINQNERSPLLIIVDDCLRLIQHHPDQVTINYLEEIGRMGRSFKIGACYSSQGYSKISEIIRASVQTVVCLGAGGRDALELARDMNLTPQQAAMLPQLGKGQAVVLQRQTWPLAVRVKVPFIE